MTLLRSLCEMTSAPPISGPAVPPTTVTYGDVAGNFGIYPVPVHVFDPVQTEELEDEESPQTQLVLDEGNSLLQPDLHP